MYRCDIEKNTYRPLYNNTLWHCTKGSATIPDHVNGSRNHLDSLLESTNQVEICESGITIPIIILVNLVFFCIL